MQKISETARGRWHGILPHLGISPKLLQNKHGPCPMCGGEDRFRFDNKDGLGTWICNKCGSGDGAELVKRVKDVGFREAAKMIEGVAGKAGVRQSWAPKSSTRDELNMLWKRAQPITPTSTVGRYLVHRCGVIPFPGLAKVLRENGNEMLAIVSGHNVDERNGVTLHRTMVGFGDEVQWRRLMPGKLPDNVAIRLGQVAPCKKFGLAMGIAEGIETALSAAILFHVPVWAAISAPLMKKWRPPEGVQKVIIFGDNDKNFTGQEAAYSLARSLSGDLEIDVKIPTLPGQDWNDVHRDIMSKA